VFDREQGVGTCTACGKNFECGAVVQRHFFFSRGLRINANAYFGKMVGANMPKQEVYHSSTLGPIPLSFTGRRLMQNLRDAFQELLHKRVEQTQRGQIGGQHDWTAVSEARGKLAQYMSQLEKRESVDPELVALRHENEVLRKANEAFKVIEKRDAERKKRLDRMNRSLRYLPEPLIYFGSRCIPVPPLKHEYFVRVLEGNFQANKRVQRKPGSVITTTMQIGGSMQVTALTSDDALNMAVEQAHKHGFTELTKKDFEVRYLGPVE
jgi:hypothetical protein